VTDYNRSLRATVAERSKAGQAITLVEMHAAVPEGDLLSDGVHPTQAGLEKIADAWFQAIKAAYGRRDANAAKFPRIRLRDRPVFA
jgi:lysophospholipase L1-like esterase